MKLKTGIKTFYDEDGNKKYPQIMPSFLKDKSGKNVAVYLKYNEYESIFDEIKELKKHISEYKKRKFKKKT